MTQVSASLSKFSAPPALASTWALGDLTANSRPQPRCSTLYTVPMPPSPRMPVTSYRLRMTSPTRQSVLRVETVGLEGRGLVFGVPAFRAVRGAAFFEAAGGLAAEPSVLTTNREAQFLHLTFLPMTLSGTFSKEAPQAGQTREKPITMLHPSRLLVP